MNDTLYVIAVISNPARYARRYQLFEEFCERMSRVDGIQLIGVELQQGTLPFKTNACIQLRTTHEVWYKENLINIGVSHLPRDWKYMAWIDTDLEFQNSDWASDTFKQLQTYDIVQLFTHAIDLGPKSEVMQVHIGFVYQYLKGDKWQPSGYGKYWHPGYAWACTRRAYDAMGGLLDFALLGSADFHMAMSFIGLSDKTVNHNLHTNYKQMVQIFENRCERHIKRNIGYVNGTILHHFHGKKADRQYQSRWKILVNNQYDPLRDMKKDCNGLICLEDGKTKLRDDIRTYFRARNEDSIDV